MKQNNTCKNNLIRNKITEDNISSPFLLEAMTNYKNNTTKKTVSQNNFFKENMNYNNQPYSADFNVADSNFYQEIYNNINNALQKKNYINTQKKDYTTIQEKNYIDEYNIESAKENSYNKNFYNDNPYKGIHKEPYKNLHPNLYPVEGIDSITIRQQKFYNQYDTNSINQYNISNYKNNSIYEENQYNKKDDYTKKDDYIDLSLNVNNHIQNKQQYKKSQQNKITKLAAAQQFQLNLYRTSNSQINNDQFENTKFENTKSKNIKIDDIYENENIDSFIFNSNKHKSLIDDNIYENNYNQNDIYNQNNIYDNDILLSESEIYNNDQLEHKPLKLFSVPKQEISQHINLFESPEILFFYCYHNGIFNSIELNFSNNWDYYHIINNHQSYQSIYNIISQYIPSAVKSNYSIIIDKNDINTLYDILNISAYNLQNFSNIKFTNEYKNLDTDILFEKTNRGVLISIQSTNNPLNKKQILIDNFDNFDNTINQLNTIKTKYHFLFNIDIILDYIINYYYNN